MMRPAGEEAKSSAAATVPREACGHKAGNNRGSLRADGTGHSPGRRGLKHVANTNRKLPNTAGQQTKVQHTVGCYRAAPVQPYTTTPQPPPRTLLLPPTHSTTTASHTFPT